MKRKVLVVFGTRPEAIKMAPVIAALARSEYEVVPCVTAQHREMLDQVLELFEIVPRHDLDLMTPGQTLTSLTAGVLISMKRILEAEKPDLVLVQGDTTTTMATGLAAFYENIPVGHIEAGLRTHDLRSPWPEEANRRFVSVVADLHFPPTTWSRGNLLREGVPEERIFVTGNTVIDALMMVKDHLARDTGLRAEVAGAFPFLDPSLRTLLVTSHRRENFGDGLRGICRALLRLSRRRDVQIVFPVHLNPRVRGPVESLLSDAPNVHLVEPQDYLRFVYLLTQADLVLSDSGGIQEEAPSLGKPVLVMRDTTERPEALEAGTARLVGTDETVIVREAEHLLDDAAAYNEMAQRANPYGDGHAAERIVQALRATEWRAMRSESGHVVAAAEGS
ncbi:MAG: UDP-N-acetylglucosamine 2-epimerase (non-hydrolyzing) [Rhodothermales bacterium]